MPFKKGVSGNPATQFTTDNQPPDENKTHGRQRSYIVREVLDLTYDVAKESMDELRKAFPQIADYLTVEEITTLMQVNKAVLFQDTAAYKALMDSAYGAPKQETELTGKDGGPVQVTYLSPPKGHRRMGNHTGNIPDDPTPADDAGH